MNKPTVGFAMCGSFCTFRKAIDALRTLSATYRVLPILSGASFETDSRFGTAADFREEIEAICGTPILHTLPAVEPFGPKATLDLLIIAPCTGNTLGKLANGITDTPVTMAAKAHLRNGRPLVLAVSTNDALGASARNIGTLMNAKNIFFVPVRQDSPRGKPASLVADFSETAAAIKSALEGRQTQPLLLQ